MSTFFAAFFSACFGSRRIPMPEYGDIQQLYCSGIFGDYYNGPTLTATVVRKYCNGSLPPPKTLIRHYDTADSTGVLSLYHNMLHVANACTSITRLWQQHDAVHAWVQTLPVDPALQTIVDTYYCGVTPTESQMAMYMAYILQYTLRCH